MSDKESFLSPVITGIRFGIVVLAFLTPLFFLPITSEFYQFNKQALVVGITSILLVLWGVRMGVEGKMRITRTPLDIPLLIFALAIILATIFSVDRYVSIAGFYPRFHGSLVSTIAYIVLYFVAASNLDRQSRTWVVWAFIGSAVVLALASIAHFFGYYIVTADYGKSRSWTPIGNPANLSLYLALVLPLALGSLVTTKNKSLQVAFLIAAIVIALPIVLFKLAGPIIATLVGLGLAAIFLPRTKISNETKSYLGIFAMVVVLVAVLNFVPDLQKNFLKPIMAKDQAVDVTPDRTLPLGSAWQIATASIGQRPFLGVGPGTFAYSFTAFKGQELNADNYWNLRFDLAGNEYLTILSTLGIIGIVAFVLVLAFFMRSLLIFNYQAQTIKDNPMSIFLFASLVIFVAGIFFQDTTASIWVFLILLAAVTYSYLKDWGVKNVNEVDVKLVALNAGGVQFVSPNDRNRDSSIGTVLSIIGVVAFLSFLYFGLPTYQAEMAYQKALVASSKDKAADTRSELLKAISKNPNRDAYGRSLAVLDRVLATNLSRKENKTDQDNKNIAGLVNESIQQGIRITGYQGRGLNQFEIRKQAGTSPLNVANWEALSGVLNSLELEGDLKTRNAADAINVAQQAVALDPKNPVLLENLGNILIKNNLVDNAIQAYEQATRVRPKYASAHYNLANALKQKGDNPARVVFELEATIATLPDNSPDKARIESELDAAKKTRDEATSSSKTK